MWMRKCWSCFACCSSTYEGATTSISIDMVTSRSASSNTGATDDTCYRADAGNGTKAPLINASGEVKNVSAPFCFFTKRPALRLINV